MAHFADYNSNEVLRKSVPFSCCHRLRGFLGATTQLGIASLTILVYIVMFTRSLAYPMHVLFGIMSDRRGCRQVYIFGALLSRQWLFPLFCWLLESCSAHTDDNGLRSAY